MIQLWTSFDAKTGITVNRKRIYVNYLKFVNDVLIK